MESTVREYKLLISHVGKDEKIALQIVDAIARFNERNDTDFKIVPIYMESETDGCIGDFMVWSENAVKRCHGVIAIVTHNTNENFTVPDGTTGNVKVVYSEVSLAKNGLRDILILRENGVELESGYNILFQNIKAQFSDLQNPKLDIDVLIREAALHAKARFAGKPILEYAGNVISKLSETSIEDTSSYLGRAAEMEAIDKYFAEGKRIVLIAGFGGIGKTTLAKMYAKRHPEVPVTIEYCSTGETSLKNAVINLKFEYEIANFDKMTEDERFEARLTQLKSVGAKTLIIIDNFNADFGNRNNISVLTALSAVPNCEFIISSRQRMTRAEVGLIDVGKLDDKELKELFYLNSGCAETPENENAVSDLIRITHGHTMTVELAAKAVAEGTNDITPREIADRLLSSDAEVRLDTRRDGYDEYETIHNHLRTLFNISEVTDSQKHMLGALSFVARGGLTVQELKDCNIFDRENLRKLCSLGYVEETRDEHARYSLHPLMSELAFCDFVSAVKEFEDMLIYLLNYKIGYTSSCAYDPIELYAGYAEQLYVRLNALYGDNSDDHKLYLAVSCNALGKVRFVKSNLVESEEYCKQGYGLATELFNKDKNANYRNTLIISCGLLGDLMIALGKFEEAEKYFEQIYLLIEVAEDKDELIEYRINMSSAYSKLGYVKYQLGKQSDAEEYCKRGYELSKDIAKENGGAIFNESFYISCIILGSIRQFQDKFEEAEQYYKQGYDIWRKSLAGNGIIGAPFQLSLICGGLGSIKFLQGNLSEAEKYCKQSYDVIKDLTEEDMENRQVRYGLLLNCLTLGNIRLEQDREEEAEKFLKQGFAISEKIILDKDILCYSGLSGICTLLGEINFQRDDYEEAEKYYKQGYDLVTELVKGSRAISFGVVLGIYCNRLGDIQCWMDEYEEAEKYYKQGYELAKELINDSAYNDVVDNFIDSAKGLALLSEDDTDIKNYLNEALKWAQFLHNNNADVYGNYEEVAGLLLDYYEEIGDDEGCQKMREILESLE